MQVRYAVGIAVVLIALGGFFLAKQKAQTPSLAGEGVPEANQIASMNTFSLTSSAFDYDGRIPPKYTCDADNINPPLAIGGVPEDAQSLVLIMDDPDAVEPAGKVWDHWVIFNMPTDTAVIGEDQMPPGVQGVNSSGGSAYSGPCPPDGEHRYFFKLYALDAALSLEAGASKAEVERAMEGHVLEQVELIGRYERK